MSFIYKKKLKVSTAFSEIRLAFKQVKNPYRQNKPYNCTSIKKNIIMSILKVYKVVGTLLFHRNCYLSFSVTYHSVLYCALGKHL